MLVIDLADGSEPCAIAIDVDKSEIDKLKEFIVRSGILSLRLLTRHWQYEAGPTLVDDGSTFEGCDCVGGCDFQAECCCIESHGSPSALVFLR